jgi:hypothetical protein
LGPLALPWRDRQARTMTKHPDPLANQPGPESDCVDLRMLPDSADPASDSVGLLPYGLEGGCSRNMPRTVPASVLAGLRCRYSVVHPGDSKCCSSRREG